MWQTVNIVWQTEGIKGFFGGVKGMMLGQSIIKALAFGVNAAALAWLQQHFTDLPATLLLLIAACLAGFVTSFVVAPIERIKVMMQASPAYRNEWHCLNVILASEGWGGLFRRGLGPTLFREVPSYGLYFWSYGFLQTMIWIDLGAWSPLVFGAAAGMFAWLPVYPIDVVKTLMQNTAGDNEEESAWEVMREVYAQGGVGAFFDGITPKLIRAAVNHAITFTIYDMIMHWFGHS
jgi:solute carrier family 25 carnitine/acylcarnitine transporter 20/29